MQYRFENQNPYPVIVPGKRGVGVTFAPGQHSTDSWYSRFCGPKQLVRVAVAALAFQPQAAKPPAPLPMLSTVESVLEEETEGWVKKSGIYYCKKCELFRTGSNIAILHHLRDHHQMDDISLTKKVPAPETSVKESLVAAPVAAPEEVEPEVAAPVETAEKAEIVSFECRYCHRKYTTEGGLGRHVAKVHDDTP